MQDAAASLASSVFQVYFDRLPPERLEETIQNALSWIKWTDKVRKDSLVFVKPNFTWPTFRPGIVTSPVFLEKLLPILKERADRVIIGESDLSVFRTSRAFRELGVDKICRANGVEMMELTRSPAVRLETKVGRRKIRL